jgi:hypothetical protein
VKQIGWDLGRSVREVNSRGRCRYLHSPDLLLHSRIDNDGAAMPDYLPLVQGLERIYEFVVALAFGEAVMQFIKKPGFKVAGRDDAVSTPHWSSLPEAIAFFATAVGFFHGMNRYLELTYAIPAGRHDLRLLVDVIVFLFEGCVLFMAAACLTERNLRCFLVLAFLFGFDAVWGVANYLSGGLPILLNWACQNVVCVAAILFFRLVWPKVGLLASILCALIVVAKMFLDYWMNWSSFYFAFLPHAVQ